MVAGSNIKLLPPQAAPAAEAGLKNTTPGSLSQQHFSASTLEQRPIAVPVPDVRVVPDFFSGGFDLHRVSKYRQTCDACKKKKKKCDGPVGHTGQCSRCRKNDAACIFSVKGRPGPKPRNDMPLSGTLDSSALLSSKSIPELSSPVGSHASKRQRLEGPDVSPRMCGSGAGDLGAGAGLPPLPDPSSQPQQTAHPYVNQGSMAAQYADMLAARTMTHMSSAGVGGWARPSGSPQGDCRNGVHIPGSLPLASQVSQPGLHHFISAVSPSIGASAPVAYHHGQPMYPSPSEDGYGFVMQPRPGYAPPPLGGPPPFHYAMHAHPTLMSSASPDAQPGPGDQPHGPPQHPYFADLTQFQLDNMPRLPLSMGTPFSPTSCHSPAHPIGGHWWVPAPSQGMSLPHQSVPSGAAVSINT